MNLLDIFGGGGQAGADGPDRLVSHDQVVCPRTVRKRSLKLPAADIQRLARIALALGFANADDRGKASAPGGLRLLPNQAVSFAVVGTSFRVADNDGGCTGVRQHFSRDIAGMGA